MKPNHFNGWDLVLLDTKTLARSVGSNYLKHHFIGPFVVLVRHTTAYTVVLPKPMATLAVSSVESGKLKHSFIGPLAVVGRLGAAYTIDLPMSMMVRPLFYVGLLKRYHDAQGPSLQLEEGPGESPPPRIRCRMGKLQ
ncbi:Pol protein [Phytophthora palmivora]|uniref:Pol protein n=1 Tax=Phytophthora palmivora TaxID=4796 RepID=A0A2P4YFB3_9STRA|nr:Pol protein [Phytophthora palmivora]